MSDAARSNWSAIAEAPDVLVVLRQCSARWLAEALPVLQRHAADDGDRERALAAVAARLDGGPLPDEVLPDRPALAAFVAGEIAAAIRFGDREGRPQRIRQLRIALPWAARALGLPAPDGMYARAVIDDLTTDADAGRVQASTWHDAVEEALIDAYLATDDPRAQSGKSGDEIEWRWSRELVLDALDGDGTILDVGCANGYLMESLHRWGAERGRVVEPYGLEISARMAALARRRLPQWADRIFVGNALDWQPPQRFDVVHTGIDYAPPRHRRALVQHLLEHVTAPDGCVVIRAERAKAGVPTPADQLRELGFVVGGTLEAVHPEHGDRRVTAWVRR